jgi:ABC-type transporter Mla maintaining outer membrane lipid asymmetry ATPase subunit MlaF
MPLFAKGIIPGALTPTSILMSHDMVAMGQITSTIYLLAEGLIQQTGDANFTDNDAV